MGKYICRVYIYHNSDANTHVYTHARIVEFFISLTNNASRLFNICDLYFNLFLHVDHILNYIFNS